MPWARSFCWIGLKKSRNLVQVFGMSEVLYPALSAPSRSGYGPGRPILISDTDAVYRVPIRQTLPSINDLDVGLYLKKDSFRCHP